MVNERECMEFNILSAFPTEPNKILCSATTRNCIQLKYLFHKENSTIQTFGHRNSKIDKNYFKNISLKILSFSSFKFSLRNTVNPKNSLTAIKNDKITGR